MTLEDRYVTEQALGRERSATLLHYLLERDADEFSITVMGLQGVQAPFADAFDSELEPFERDVAPRAVGIAPALHTIVRPVRVWSLDSESLRRLLSFFDEGLFHSPAGPDGWLEDLTIYRAGEIVLSVASHERIAVLRLTPSEHAHVAALGIATSRTYE